MRRLFPPAEFLALLAAVVATAITTTAVIPRRPRPQELAEDLYNRAQRALSQGALGQAAIDAERMAAHGGPAFYGLRDFLLGNCAFLKARKAAAQAEIASADPTSIVQAIEGIMTAQAQWKRAALSRPNWLAARKNLLRADAELIRLRERKAELEAARKAKQNRSPKKKAQGPRETEERQARMQSEARGLNRAQLAKLLRKLDADRVAKRALRRKRRMSLQKAVRHDW